jgi:hypothetical protein
MRWSAIPALFFLLTPCGLAVAQKEPAPTGTVTGHVVCADTQQPARFAEVVLVLKPEAVEADSAAEKSDSPAPKKPSSLVSLSGLSGLDGVYAIAKVPPGDYYAVPRLDGYVVPIAMPTSKDEADNVEWLAAQLPVVHVQAGRTMSVDLTLRRGAVIAGRAVYDDGSPVIDASIRVQAIQGDLIDIIEYLPLRDALLNSQTHNSFSPFGGNGRLRTRTDDNGRYRIGGLLPGKYLVATSVETGGGFRTRQDGDGNSNTSSTGADVPTVTVYGPATQRKSKARVFDIRADEQIGDADIEVRLHGLHVVRGTVLVKEDRHVPQVSLIGLREDGEESTTARLTRLGADGSFRFDYVPSGSYKLYVYCQDFQPGTQVLKQYEQVQISMAIGEDDVLLDEVLLVDRQQKPTTAESPE